MSSPLTYTEFIEQLTMEGLESFGLFYSCYEGEVVDNVDPNNLGGLKVKCPALYGDQIWEDFIMPKGVPAGLGAGIFWLPNSGDPVYITCKGGNPRFPIWEYGWWLRDKMIAGAESQVYVFLTPSGHRVELSDKVNTIDIKHKDGFHVKLSSDGFFIGKDDQNLGKVLDDLFQLFAETTVATPGGPAPFNNVIEYDNLRTTLLQFIKTS